MYILLQFRVFKYNFKYLLLQQNAFYRKMLNTKTGAIEDITAFVLFSCSTVKYLDSFVVFDMLLLIKIWHNHAGR